MPRISAPTVAEHHARRREAILDAAGDLFAERGVVATDLKDVAAAVGLSRTALYRYFPDRDRLFLAWADRTLGRVLADLDAALADVATPRGRLDAWIAFQLDHVTGHGHAVGRRIQHEVGALPPALRDRVAAAHEQIADRVRPAVAELAAPGRDVVLLTRMVGAAVQAAGVTLDAGDDPSALLDDARDAVHGLLDLRP